MQRQYFLHILKVYFSNYSGSNSRRQNSQSMKWHPLFIKWCLYLRYLSGKSYELLRNSGCIKLPSQSTLRDYTHNIRTTIGFFAEVDKDLLKVLFLNQARAGRRPARAWFLNIDMVRTSVCVCVCVSVCVSAPRAIKNYSRERKSE